jgi:hypothetical protein
MTAAEDEPQAVVVQGRRRLAGSASPASAAGARAVPSRAACASRLWIRASRPAGAAQAVDRLRRAAVVSHAAGRSGAPSAPPRHERRRAGVLHGVLGEGDVAADVPDERGEDGRAVLADGPLERGGDVRHPKTWTGRTSTAP